MIKLTDSQIDAIYLIETQFPWIDSLNLCNELPLLNDEKNMFILGFMVKWEFYNKDLHFSLYKEIQSYLEKFGIRTFWKIDTNFKIKNNRYIADYYGDIGFVAVNNLKTT